MKRILVVGLVLLFLSAGGGGLIPHDAEAQEIDCNANDLSEYDALQCYFSGAINRQRLESFLPQYGPTAGTTASGLVSNLGQTATSGSTSFDYQHQFTTGAMTAPGGSDWAITSVRLVFDFQVSNPATRPTVEVSIRAAGSWAEVGTFSRSGALVNGVNTFVPQGGNPIHLQPNTQYLLRVDVITSSSGSGADVGLGFTTSNTTDPGLATSWSIATFSSNRQFDGGGSFNALSPPDSMRFALDGYAEIAPTSRTIRQWGSNFTQSTTCGGKPNPIHEAFRRDPLGTDWSQADRIFCNESTGQWVVGRAYQQGVDFSRTEDLITPSDSRYPAKCRYDKPGYRHNADGTVTVIHGANYDPLADVCTQRGTALDTD